MSSIVALGRSALVIGLLLACPALHATQSGPKPTSRRDSSKTPAASDVTLRQLADQIGFRIGATIAPPIFDQPQHQAVLGREYNTAESVLQFRMVQPQEGRFNFTRMDREMAYVRAHKMTLFGGPLIYKRQSLPPWMDKWFWTEGSLDSAMRAHVQTVMRHGAGVYAAWEVVNEPLTTENWPFGHVWNRVEYITRAFRYAREADPHATLVLNQSFGRSGVDQTFVDQFFDLIQQLKAKGAPVDAAGIEMHLEMQMMRPEYLQEFRDYLTRAASTGVQVYITEMDVYQGPPGAVPDPFARQKQIYHDVLAACLASPACKAYYTWGLTDQFNMYQHREADPHPDAKPLPFDENYQKKPAYYGLLEALQERVNRSHAAKRPH